MGSRETINDQSFDKSSSMTSLTYSQISEDKILSGEDTFKEMLNG